MRIPRQARELNSQFREGVARKHARYMGMDDWKAIDRKIQDFGNDYYDTRLFPDRSVMQQAIDGFESGAKTTPAMEQVAGDLRQFYGLTPSAPLPASTPAVVSRPAPVEGLMQGPAQAFKDKKVAEVKAQMFGPEPPPARVEDDLVMQQQVAAAEQQQQQIDRLVTQAQEDLEPTGWFMDDPYLETALLAAAALGTGGIIGRVTAPDEDR